LEDRKHALQELLVLVEHIDNANGKSCVLSPIHLCLKPDCWKINPCMTMQFSISFGCSLLALLADFCNPFGGEHEKLLQ
jgi:hypothetical protein